MRWISTACRTDTYREIRSIDECPTHVFYGYHYTLNLLRSAEMPDAIFAIT